MMIPGEIKPVGIFGCPIGHTLSPAMHNFAFERLGIPAIYLPFVVEPKHLEAALSSLIPLGFLGVNLTIPHKEAALKWIETISSEVEQVGAINAVVVRQGERMGYNTDVEGFLASLQNDLRWRPKGKKVLVLGAGGAARAVIYALAEKGAQSIFVGNRTVVRARRLVQEFRRNFPAVAMEWFALSEESTQSMAKQVDLIVQTTSMGMDGGSLKISWREIPKTTSVIDVVYRPLETPFVKGARSAGLKATGGLGMLLYQGAASFKLWTGRQMPIATVHKHLLQELSRSTS
jgi:shikimate dehydrogenase